jgi:hypothetical protein
LDLIRYLCLYDIILTMNRRKFIVSTGSLSAGIGATIYLYSDKPTIDVKGQKQVQKPSIPRPLKSSEYFDIPINPFQITARNLSTSDDITVYYELRRASDDSKIDSETENLSVPSSNEFKTNTNGKELRVSHSDISGNSENFYIYVDISHPDVNKITVKSPNFAIKKSGAYFNVSIVNIPNSISEGDTLQVDYEVENTGNKQATQDIRLNINGAKKDSNTVSLNQGITSSGSLQWSANSGPGTYNVTVESDNTVSNRQVDVNSSISTGATLDWRNNISGSIFDIDAPPQNMWVLDKSQRAYEIDPTNGNVNYDFDVSGAAVSSNNVSSISELNNLNTNVVVVGDTVYRSSDAAVLSTLSINNREFDVSQAVNQNNSEIYVGTISSDFGVNLEAFNISDDGGGGVTTNNLWRSLDIDFESELSLSYANGTIHVGYTNSSDQITGFNRTDGSETYNQPTNIQFPVNNIEAISGTDAISLQNGDTIARNNTNQREWTSIQSDTISYNGTSVFGSYLNGSSELTIVSINPSNGNQRWSKVFPSVSATPNIMETTDDRIYLGFDNGDIGMFSLEF